MNKKQESKLMEAIVSAVKKNASQKIIKTFSEEDIQMLSEAIVHNDKNKLNTFWKKQKTLSEKIIAEEIEKIKKTLI